MIVVVVVLRVIVVLGVAVVVSGGSTGCGGVSTLVKDVTHG